MSFNEEAQTVRGNGSSPSPKQGVGQLPLCIERIPLISIKIEGEFHEGVQESSAYALGLQIPCGIL